MSSYFPLPLEGFGTTDIESFGCYLHRLAYTHGVSTWQFIAHVHQWYGSQKGNHTSFPVYLLYAQSLAICSYGEDLGNLISIIEKCCHVTGLRAASFQVLHDVLSRKCIGVVKPSREWCPACYAERRRTGLVLYDKLQWCSKYIVRCQDHKIALSDKCPACGKRQKYYDAIKPIDVCKSCNASLIGDPSKWQIMREPTEGEYDILTLIDHVANDPNVRLKANAVRDFINGVHKRKLSRVLSRALDLAPSHLVAYQRQLHKFTLKGLIKITTTLDVPLVLLLTQPETAASIASLDIQWNKVIGKVHQPKFSAHTKRLIKLKLIEIIHDSNTEHAPGLNKICVSLGVSRGFMAHNFPVQVRAIILRRKRYISRKRMREYSTVARMLRDELYVNYRDGLIRSQDQVVEMLVQRCSTSKAIARRALRWALTAAESTYGQVCTSGKWAIQQPLPRNRRLSDVINKQAGHV